MRPRLLAAALVVATATGSALVTTYRESRADAKERDTALSAVVISSPDPATSSFFVEQEGLTWALSLRSDGPEPVVLRRVGWVGSGEPLTVEKSLLPGRPRLVRLSLGSCPAHRVVTGFDRVEVVVAARGAEKVLQIDLVSPEEPRGQLNGACGLYSVRESTSSAVRHADLRAGHVRLDVGLGFGGERDTELLAVTGPAGVRLSVAGRLPVTVPPTGDDNALLPTLLTVTLDLVDCTAVETYATRLEAPVVRDDPDRAPRYDEIQVSARRPGEPVETVNIGYGREAANAFAAACDVPDIPEEVAG